MVTACGSANIAEPSVERIVHPRLCQLSCRPFATLLCGYGIAMAENATYPGADRRCLRLVSMPPETFTAGETLRADRRDGGRPGGGQGRDPRTAGGGAEGAHRTGEESRRRCQGLPSPYVRCLAPAHALSLAQSSRNTAGKNCRVLQQQKPAYELSASVVTPQLLVAAQQ